MTNTAWIELIETTKNGDENYFNQKISEEYIRTFKSQLIKLTKDDAVAREVYSLAICKFWERFILKKEEIPKSNIQGYLFNMARNAFIDLKRKEKLKLNKVQSLSELELTHAFSQSIKHSTIIDTVISANSEKEYQIRLLYEAFNGIDEVCQELIQRNICNSEKLTALKIELGFFGAYQSIVDKKKRCVKKLTKTYYKILESNQHKQELI